MCSHQPTARHRLQPVRAGHQHSGRGTTRYRAHSGPLVRRSEAPRPPTTAHPQPAAQGSSRE
eukprot:scaffold15379_cov133-Isochrysis_galbana.AAC.3